MKGPPSQETCNAVGRGVVGGDPRYLEWWATAVGVGYHLVLLAECMGDKNAVRRSQENHLQTLRSEGCAAPENLVVYRSPVPSEDLLEIVYVDDHDVILILPRVDLAKIEPGMPDVDLLEKADRAYKKVGLITKVR